MKTLPLRPLAAALALFAGACAHTPPGTSVEVALARKPELLRLPTPVAPVVSNSALAHSGAEVNVPVVEPPLPEVDSKVERVAEAYAQGNFCLEAGQEEEARAAFEKAVEIDPSFGDAWQSLAQIYEKKGEEEKAKNAFRHAKTLARQ